MMVLTQAMSLPENLQAVPINIWLHYPVLLLDSLQVVDMEHFQDLVEPNLLDLVVSDPSKVLQEVLSQVRAVLSNQVTQDNLVELLQVLRVMQASLVDLQVKVVDFLQVVHM